MLILVVKKKKKLEKTCSAGYVTLGLLATFSFEASPNALRWFVSWDIICGTLYH